MPRTPRSTIRRSRPRDLQCIHEWLDHEERRGVHGNFLCNWSIIKSAHRNGELLVYVDGRTQRPVAFQLGGLLQPGILQVHSNFRGTGIGQKLVERCVSDAIKRDECLLFIECKPSSSIPFWQRMGFTLLGGTDGKNYAYRVLPKYFDLPGDGTPTEVIVRFYSEERKWEEAVAPLLEARPPASRSLDGTVRFAERVSFHKALCPKSNDPVVELSVDGRTLYLDKAKYERGAELGIRRCINGFYIDSINERTAQEGLNPTIVLPAAK